MLDVTKGSYKLEPLLFNDMHDMANEFISHFGSPLEIFTASFEAQISGVLFQSCPTIEFYRQI
jgi:hypothetical protein